MDSRVQEALDGEITRATLTKLQATAFAQSESMIDGVLRAIPQPPIPDLGLAVLERIAAFEPGHAVAVNPARNKPRRRFVSWLFSTRTVVLSWRPAYALGAVATVALAIVFQVLHFSSMPLIVNPNRPVLVQFRLDAPQAQHVALAGDFTDWKPAYALRRSEPGVWTVVVPLNPGVHNYAFVVDGRRWTPDPMAPAIADGFGGLNSRLAVLAPESGRGI